MLSNCRRVSILFFTQGGVGCEGVCEVELEGSGSKTRSRMAAARIFLGERNTKHEIDFDKFGSEKSESGAQFKEGKPRQRHRV